MRKRIFSLILAAVMVFSLLPAFASAEGENPERVAPAKTIENPGWTDGSSGLLTNKDLSYDPYSDTYTITMEAYATGEVIKQKLQTGYPLDIAIVVDQSGSMEDSVESLVPSEKTSWTLSDLSGGTYYVKDGSQYYPVEYDQNTAYVAKQNVLLNSVLSTDTILNNVSESSNNTNGTGYVYYYYPTDYYMIGTDSTYHRIYATFEYYIDSSNYYMYGVSLYYFTDETEASNHQQGSQTITVKRTFADDFESYSDFKNLADQNKIVFVGLDNNYNYITTYNNRGAAYRAEHFSNILYQEESVNTAAYYTKQTSNGTEIVPLIENSDGTYSGTLYTNGTAPKYQVLRQAVTDFCQTVAEKAVEYNTEHKIALIGFAGNEEVNIYSAKPGTGSVYHSSHASNAYGYYDYVNTGLFVGNDFINYKTIVGFDPHTVDETVFSNMHYFIEVNGKMHPIAYNSSQKRWYDVEASTFKSNGSHTYSYVTPNDTDYGWNPAYTTNYGTRTYYSAVYNTIDEYGERNSTNYYQDALVPAHVNDADGVNDALTNAINRIGCLGGTYTSYGMAMANQIFANNTEMRSRCIKDEAGNIVDQTPVQPLKVVILFTDGQPGGSGYDPAIAGEALADAAIIKEVYSAQIYSLGLFDSQITGNAETFAKVQAFMKGVSSDQFATTTNVSWSDLEPSSQYFYKNEYENKTYSVSCDGSMYIINDSGDGITHYLPWQGSSYWNIGPRNGTSSNLYTKNGSQYVRVSRSSTLDRNTVYYAHYDANGNLSNSTSDSDLKPVTYDYYWQDSNGYVKFASGGVLERVGDDQFFTYETYPSGEELEYYATVSDAYSLTSRFNAIASDIQTPTSYASLSGTNSVLKDIITDNFTLPTEPNSHINLQTVKGTYNANSQPTWTSVTENPEGVIAAWSGKTLTVNGFDYSSNFIGDGHPGQKLVVTVSGLKLNADARGDDLNRVFSNTDASGIYKTTDESESMYQPFNNPYFELVPGDVTYVADFSAKLKLAEGVTDDKYVDASEDNHNGTFARETDDVATYQLKAGEALSDGANLTMSGADTAIIYGKFYDNTRADGTKTAAASAAWKNVTVVPASSVYFDDSFNDAQNPTTLTVGDGSGYNVGVTNASSSDAAANTEKKEFVFTFTGTAIDIYCTTHASGGLVQAALFDSTGTTRIGKAVAMRNYAPNDRYNVPSVFFEAPEWGTYVVKITAGANAQYKFDGVRVYNPMGSNETAQTAYEDVNEQNATFTSLRTLLLEDGMVTLEEPGEGGVGFFTDKGDAVSVAFKPKADSDEYERVEYSAHSLDAYTIDGPKNEIYLTNNQAIAFQVTNLSELDNYVQEGGKLKVMVGLSVYGGTANAYIDNADHTKYVTPNTVDQYYELTPDENGVFKIICKNAVPAEGSNEVLLAVTNLKVSGADVEIIPQKNTFAAQTEAAAEGPAEVPMYLAVTEKVVHSMAMANAEIDGAVEEIPAEPAPEPTTEPTEQPSIMNWIRQIISDFVSALFGSIARLFGH